MKPLPFYQEVLNCDNEDEVFKYLIDTLSPSIRAWDYFVNWDKVTGNASDYEPVLAEFDKLLGSANFDDDFRTLLRKNNQAAKVIPALLVRDGSRTSKFYIANAKDSRRSDADIEEYDFAKVPLSDNDIEKCLTFVSNTGLKRMLLGEHITDLDSYMVGVEAGLDSNARKNRAGKAMEMVTGKILAEFCSTNGYTFKTQVERPELAKLCRNVAEAAIPDRCYDFVIQTKLQLFLIETSFYSATGSKPKASAGEYRDLAPKIEQLPGFKFIWITDGPGWRGSKKPLWESFDEIDLLFNLDMLRRGVLHQVIA